MVVTELWRLRQATSPGLDSVKHVLDRSDDLIFILHTLSQNTADLQRRRMSMPGPKLGVRAPGNIRHDPTPTNGTQLTRISGGSLKRKAYQKRLVGWSSSPDGVSALILSSSMEGRMLPMELSGRALMT